MTTTTTTFDLDRAAARLGLRFITVPYGYAAGMQVITRTWIGEPLGYRWPDGSLSARADRTHQALDVVPPSAVEWYVEIVAAHASVFGPRVPDLVRSALLDQAIATAARMRGVPYNRILEEAVPE
jgi:hypothetical protein